MKKKYKVVFSMDREGIAESESEAEEYAKDFLLSNNWYYVHDYIDLQSITCLWEPTQEELDEDEE